MKAQRSPVVGTECGRAITLSGTRYFLIHASAGPLQDFLHDGLLVNPHPDTPNKHEVMVMPRTGTAANPTVTKTPWPRGYVKVSWLRLSETLEFFPRIWGNAPIQFCLDSRVGADRL